VKNPNWPAYVSISNGRVVYRPRIKGEPPEGYGIDSRGFLKPPIKLGKPSDSDDIILARYLETRKILQQDENEIGHKKNSLFWIRDKYLNSAKFKELAKSTQQSYEVHLKVFLNTEIELRVGKVLLGLIKPTGLTLPGINTIKERIVREEVKKGRSGISYVNGHIRSARAMMTWALNHIEGLGVTHNPFQGISLGKENKRERYVTDDEYMEQYLFAVDHSPEYLPLIFEHCYLLACRSIEATGLKVADLIDEGYVVRRTKGSKDNIIAYTPRLLAAKDATIAYREKTKCKGEWLIPSTAGSKLTKDTLQSAMADLKKKMHGAGKSAICWNLHDLKRKGISDSKDSRIGGHKSDHIRQRYMVKLESFQAPA
jgi:integrase